MLDDDLAHGVGVDEADVEDKGNQVVVKYDRLKVQVRGDEGPGHEIRDEAVKGQVERFILLAADVEDVLDTTYLSLAIHHNITAVVGAYLESVLKTKTRPPYTIHHSFQERL